ncbi:tetratricopeptide repeat protein [Streptacidiphilus sp. PB12-B1b]|uniref:tetratricopeptide repeat protein n=1 Tax=Streptacidiphilus sp. PB12-B1b TaxID=2705012 RepID=UPI0015FCAF3F|nr:tetratricopeptide repeat protein [Streptacidiphilus sp. PB12-B1b]QMU78784.1 tetratricopeptide repeat protein [Streptacidiphilus sp. PB12-B1b]
MIARVTYTVVSAALLLGFVVIAVTGGQLIATGNALAIGIGISAEVLVVLGCWFLWKTYRFGRRSGQLARELEAEGALPVDELERTAGGRIDRDSADRVFARRQAETESSPDDWRAWFRLAVAYADARDTPRARKAMQRAIKLHDVQA